MAIFKRRPLRLRSKNAKRGLYLNLLVGGIILAVIGGILYGIWFVTRMPQFTIDTITVEGGPTVSSETIEEVIEDELGGTYFLIVPKRFTYLYPYKKIVERVLAIPRIAKAEVARTDKKTLHVAFSEHVPYALWCTDAVHEGGSPSCVFISKGGYAFAEAPSLKGTAFMRYMIEGRDPETDTQIFDTERIQGMELFMHGLRSEFGFRVYSVTLTKDQDIVYHLDGGSSILLTDTIGVQEAFDNLHSVPEAPEFQGLVPGQFDYIDLRFGNRVFVKEEFTTPEEETATSTELLEAAE